MLDFRTVYVLDLEVYRGQAVRCPSPALAGCVYEGDGEVNYKLAHFVCFLS